MVRTHVPKVGLRQLETLRSMIALAAESIPLTPSMLFSMRGPRPVPLRLQVHYSDVSTLSHGSAQARSSVTKRSIRLTGRPGQAPHRLANLDRRPARMSQAGQALAE
jgi:hypothetical protein